MTQSQQVHLVFCRHHRRAGHDNGPVWHRLSFLSWHRRGEGGYTQACHVMQLVLSRKEVPVRWCFLRKIKLSQVPFSSEKARSKDPSALLRLMSPEFSTPSNILGPRSRFSLWYIMAWPARIQNSSHQRFSALRSAAAVRCGRASPRGKESASRHLGAETQDRSQTSYFHLSIS